MKKIHKFKIVLLFLILLGSCDLFISDVKYPHTKVILELESSRSLSDIITICEVVVSGEHMETLTFTQDVGSTFNLTIPSGDNTTFNINLYNSDSSILLFSGSTTVNLEPSKTKQLEINTYQSARQLVYDGNENISGSEPEALYYNDNSQVVISGNTGLMEKTGYMFTGWNTVADGSGTSYSANSTLTLSGSKVTLYAVWIQSPPYTITYNLDGGASSLDDGTVPTDDTSYLSGDEVILNEGYGIYYKTYNFIGWAIESGGDVISSYTITNHDETFYAVWFDPSTIIEDIYESDDSREDADNFNRTLILNAEAQYHTIDIAGEEDWFKFNATAGETYTFFTSNTGNGTEVDTYMYLYDGAEPIILIKENDDFDDLYSVITYTFDVTGTYYIMVREYRINAEKVDYNISVIDTEYVLTEEYNEEM